MSDNILPRSGKVLIVGAGPSSMAAALEMSKWGVKVVIIDALETPRTTSRAGGIQPRTFELLDRYEMSDTLIAGRPGIGFATYRNGKEVGRLQTSLARSRYRDPPPTPQATFEKVFRDRLAEQGVHILWSHRLVALEQDEAGVTASVETPEGLKTITVDWLLGCDGASSATRGLIGLEFEGESYEESYALLDAELDWDLPPDTLRGFRNDGDPQSITLVPFTPTQYRIQINRPIEMLDTPPTVEEMQEVFDRVVKMRGKISNPIWASSYRFHRRQVVTYRNGRVFLAGDAAHIHSAAGAQGLNTGVGDGINLGWKMGLVVSGKADPKLLDTYEEERKPIADGVLKLSDALMRNADAALNNPNIPPQVMADTHAQLLVNYRAGPLGQAAPGQPGASLVAGDRLPDVEIDGATIYRRMKDANIVVALFGSAAEIAEAEAALTRFGRAITLWRHPAGDPLAAAIGLTTGAAVVRPDAYLGLVVPGEPAKAAAEVGAWLQSTLRLAAA